MNDILDIIAWLIVAPALFALGYLIVELLAGLVPKGAGKWVDASERDIAFLVPAHNEQNAIATTVANIVEKAPSARVVVVADNCSDETATRAREAGAEVIERFDAKRRGKGYALAFGRDHLAKDPPEIVIVVDADCSIGDNFADTMGAAIASHQSPVQSSNLFVADRTVARSVQVSNFAMLVKNLYRMRGMYRLGGSISLLGTGMGFPWPLFSVLPLATSDATEDIKLGLDLVSNGTSIAFEERAQVWSRAESASDTVEQRKRWEHGFLDHSLRYGLPALAKGLAGLSRARIALGLHMLVPPLALLILASVLLAALAAALRLLGATAVPAIALSSALGLAALLLVVAWLQRGRAYLSGRAIATLPLYLVWKLPIYLSFLTRRQKSWDQRS